MQTPCLVARRGSVLTLKNTNLLTVSPLLRAHLYILANVCGLLTAKSYLLWFAAMARHGVITRCLGFDIMMVMSTYPKASIKPLRLPPVNSYQTLGC